MMQQKPKNSQYIHGVEFSCLFQGMYQMHLLGYDFNPSDLTLHQLSDNVSEKRKERVQMIFDILNQQYGLIFSLQERQSVLSQNNPGRPHIARLLVQKGFVSSISEAFKNYLNQLHVPINYRLDTKQTIQALHQAGGIALIAHPIKIEKKYQCSIESLLPDFKAIGLDGIEAGNCLHSYQDFLRYEQLALQYGLCISAGSDYHGLLTKPQVQIGEVYSSNEPAIIDINRLTFLKEVKRNG